MTLIDKISRLLLAPPATGRKALLYGIVLIVTPALARLLLERPLADLPFVTYLPFVIIAALVLHWRYAVAVALISWLVADLLFMVPRYQITIDTTELVGFVMFQASSVMVIAMAESVRRIVENSLRPARPDGFSVPVIFSLERGQAWASWPGSHSWVRLGPEDEVAEMMEDFLAQREIGRRLNVRSGAAIAVNP